jgi:hypothetical protein
VIIAKQSADFNHFNSVFLFYSFFQRKTINGQYYLNGRELCNVEIHLQILTVIETLVGTTYLINNITRLVLMGLLCVANY